jgi:hypothetical protein
MKKLSKKDYEEAINFLEENKHLVGFEGYEINLKEEIVNDPTATAICNINVLEKTLHICLTELYLVEDFNKRKNTLMHELIHGRVLLFNRVVEEFSANQEELMDNFKVSLD